MGPATTPSIGCAPVRLTHVLMCAPTSPHTLQKLESCLKLGGAMLVKKLLSCSAGASGMLTTDISGLHALLTGLANKFTVSDTPRARV